MIEGKLVEFGDGWVKHSRRVQGETEAEFMADVKRAAEEWDMERYQVERYRN